MKKYINVSSLTPIRLAPTMPRNSYKPDNPFESPRGSYPSSAERILDLRKPLFIRRNFPCAGEMSSFLDYHVQYLMIQFFVAPLE